MFNFFFDTADEKYIKEKWELYKSHVLNSYCLGVTTNPNAFSKENLHSMSEWKEKTKKLVSLVTEIRNGDENGVVYVQMPFDSLSKADLMRWVKEFSNLTDGMTRVGLKIPPYPTYLDMAEEINRSFWTEINVTGIADCVTALQCVTRPSIKYISMIPGRMEEVGIDAKKHVANAIYGKPLNSKWEIITGSMRTLDGLKWCVLCGTIPTIGKRVLDLITPENAEEVFGTWQPMIKIEGQKMPHPHFIGPDAKTADLSRDFFTQMNELGRFAAEELRKNDH